MNAGASTYAVPSPIKGSGTAWVLLGSWALSPARPTPIHPRHECRGLSALFGEFCAASRPTRGILLVLSNCKDPAREAAFHRWYEDIHVADILQTGAFHTAYRYESLDPPGDAGHIPGALRDGP